MPADPTDGHWVVVNGAALAWYDHTGRRWTLDPDLLMDTMWTAATPDVTYPAFAALIDALRAARVVAGRPDQPTHTTPLAGKVDHVRYREDDNETVIEVIVPGYCTQAFNDPALWDRRVTVYATDPHTPNQGDTP